MPAYLYTCPEPRTVPHVPVELDEDGEPVAFAAHDLLEGDVIEAARNPDELRFEETDLPVGLVPRPVAAVGDDTSAPGQDASRRPSRRRTKAEKAFDALSDDDRAALEALTDDERQALTSLTAARDA